MPSEILEGRALRLGDHVNADQLHPPAFFSLDPTRVAAGFLGGLSGPPTQEPQSSGWIIVAGRNFGCGSSRETTLGALTSSGVHAVVAESVGRIFFRSAAAVGLPCWTTAAPLDSIAPNDALEIDLRTPALRCLSSGRTVPLDPHDPFIAQALTSGGLLGWLATRQR